MKKIVGWVQTNMVGSRCEFEFEMEDNATPDEIMKAAEESAFELIEWNFEVEGENA